MTSVAKAQAYRVAPAKAKAIAKKARAGKKSKPAYDIHLIEETLWSVLIAEVTVGAQYLITFDPSTVVDWKTWAMGVGVASVRIGMATFLNYVKDHAE